MENHSSQSLSSEQNKNSVAIVPYTQAPPWSEAQGDDWNLHEFLGIIRRRGLVIAAITMVVMGAVVYSTLKQKPVYEGNFRLLVEPLNQESTLLGLTSSKQNSNSSQPNLDYESQIQVLKSPGLITGIAKLLERSEPNINYSSLVNSLTITRLGETKIIEVRYQSNDPKQIKVVLDRVAQTYLKYSLEERQTSLRQGLQFVEKQLKSMQMRVDQLQKEQQIFRQKYKLTDPDVQGAQISDRANSLAQQRLTVDQQLATSRAKLTSLQKQTGELAALNGATVYQQLMSQVRQLDTQIATELTRFQEDSPPVQALKEKREKLLPLLSQEAGRFLNVEMAKLTTEVQTLEVQSQELAKAEQKLEQQRKQLPVLARKYTESQRKLQVATESLNRFLSTRESLQIQVAQTELPWQLIQAPIQPTAPVSPDIRRSLISGFVLSLILGISAALLIEKMDNTYHSLDALKKKVKEPILGALPFEKQVQNIPVGTSKPKISIKVVPDSFSKHIYPLTATTEQRSNKYSTKFLEALRVLYTNIQLLSFDRPIRSLVVSSAMLEDGKSTVAFHLAQTAAAMGHRVLLVDADMRRPVIHSLSDLNNQWGLSNLVSTNLPVVEVIRQPSCVSQLSVLTAGPVPPDPTKLLSSEKMKRLIESFHSSFDLVIYDAPPLVGLADASLLAPHTDGILLVARLHKTNCLVLKQALDNLKRSRMTVLGIVANGQTTGSLLY
ncbi:capsular biosynthesis protein [Scytonema hofmannii PCC 7110]|uniref:Capsular biosynthesis protein n=1 Tax=Scytonema hofmannii PCC 7110 TaxID=128403 RepID=A0A139WZG2_9CYAN|nr:polysaccharide biosynthesis tyrosine autokinase [Scytonema hofmannii]KYC37762.1 capsular biosynthesis protein [Scytonema hofmannii PCC 7110]